jgi:hydrogenase maturation protein HypF
MTAPASQAARERRAVRVTGVVQGVGFRPFVHSRAHVHGLAGWVRNSRSGVELEIEGVPSALDALVHDLRRRAPAPARVDAIELTARAPLGDTEFQIRPSEHAEAAGALPAPDQATCGPCSEEVAAAGSRRAGYPFTTCAACGPRYTIADGAPYDRARTAMRGFAPCAACRAEYDDPSDRRFHAETIACATCGPRLELLGPDGGARAVGPDALAAAVAALRSGRLVAVKGLGGFQFLADATDDAAVARLRAAKGRDEKPFAVLVADMVEAQRRCRVSDAEAALLGSAAAPIVLLDRRGDGEPLAPLVAPGLRRLGVMLPTTPLHELIARDAGRPLVCTSGNRAEEPLFTEVAQALARLPGAADLWLTHDRPIVRPIDDSVVQVGPCGPEMLRRARGYVPLPLPAPGLRETVLAFGGHQKSTATLLHDGRFLVGEHVGDLGTPAAVARLERVADELCRLAGASPQVIACDAHPDYASTGVARRWARERAVPLIAVQHHHAHAAACLIEHGLSGPALALVWDGAGLGDDGTLWGGELLRVDGGRFDRLGRLRPFPLPGGTRALRDPSLALAGLAAASFGADAERWLAGVGLASVAVARALAVAARPSLAPLTSSVGRLFDAVAALLDLRRRPGYEGAAAMQLQDAAERAVGPADPYPMAVSNGELAVEPLLRGLAADRAAGVPGEVAAARFHETLAAAAVGLTAVEPGVPVVLAGGCFQNRLLSARVRARLEAAGRTVFSPRQFPANDGALSLGQAAVAAWRLQETR